MIVLRGRWGRLLPVAMMAIALVVSLGRAQQHPAVLDSVSYLSLARGVQTYGVYGEVAYPEARPQPSMLSPPLYPLLVSAALGIDSRFSAYAACRFSHPLSDVQACMPSNWGLIVIQSLLAAMAIGFVYAIARLVTGSALVGVLASALAIHGFAQWTDLILTEALCLPLLTAALYALLRGCRGGPRPGLWFAAAGVGMALAALTRPSFLYVGIVMVLVVALGWRYGNHRSGRRAGVLRICAAYVVPLLLVCAPWVVRNAISLGQPGFTANYQNLALSVRLSYNEMTPQEWVTGFLYWMPDGGHVATPVMGRDSWRRLDFDEPNGFYRGAAAFRARAAQESGANFAHGGDSSDQMSAWLIDHYLVNRLPKHIAVSVVLAWRGAMIEKWGGFVGFFVLIGYLIAGRPRRARAALWIVTAPPVLNLAFNAFFTLDIPRYNFWLLVPYSTVLGWGLMSLADVTARRLGIPVACGATTIDAA